MSGTKQDPPSDPDHHAYTADNSISLSGIDVEALNALARNVQERLSGGFGEFWEEGSHTDNRTAQLPKLTKLLAEVDRLNDSLQKLVAARVSKNGDSTSMGEGNSANIALGGKQKTLAAQLQELQEQMTRMATKSERLENDVNEATAQAKEATRKMEATQLENETLRKDVDRQGKKLKELERKASRCGPPSNKERWDEQFEKLQVQVQAATGKAGHALTEPRLLQDRLEAVDTERIKDKLRQDTLMSQTRERFQALDQRLDSTFQQRLDEVYGERAQDKDSQKRAISSIEDRLKKVDKQLDRVFHDDEDGDVTFPWVPPTLQRRITRLEVYISETVSRRVFCPQVLVWNLPMSITEDQLSSSMVELLDAKSALQTNMFYDDLGNRGGTAVVYSPNEYETLEAIRMDGMFIGDQKVSVQEVFYPKDDTIVTNYSGWILVSGGLQEVSRSGKYIPDPAEPMVESTSTYIRDFMDSVGHFRRDMKIKMAMNPFDTVCGFALIKLADEVEVTRAFRLLHGKEFSRNRMHVGIVQGYDGT